jgi:hypothetical protein
MRRHGGSRDGTQIGAHHRARELAPRLDLLEVPSSSSILRSISVWWSICRLTGIDAIVEFTFD